MESQDKQLLLKDLCSRLPYGVWVQYEGKEWLVTGYGHGRVSLLPSVFSSAVGPCPLIDEVKPYLRPMLSMTEKEKKEHDFYCGYEPYDENIGESYLTEYDMPDYIDFLLEHHLDFRGLIPKGLALEAPVDMYKQ